MILSLPIILTLAFSLRLVFWTALMNSDGVEAVGVDVDWKHF